MASGQGHVNIVEVLITAGADVNLTDKVSCYLVANIVTMLIKESSQIINYISKCVRP